ncbi:MAG: nitroreductase [Proteobacteria bacterium]|nr:nitroreductase [Pseudomonadota bacterium]
MDALEALHTRVSAPRLSGEVSSQALNNILKAALRAPDHALLRPWRFLIVRGSYRHLLGDLFVRAARQQDAGTSEAQLEKVRSKPLRAPVILIGIARLSEHPKVPEVEQLLSCGAAMQNMSVAAFAQGLGAIWRTGSMAYDRVVQEGLGVADDERIVGYLYLGQVEGRSRKAPELDVDDYVDEWTGTQI